MRVFAWADGWRRREVLESLGDVMNVVGRDADVVDEVVLPETMPAEDALGLLRTRIGEREARCIGCRESGS